MEEAQGRSDEPSDIPKLVRLFPNDETIDENPMITDPEGPRHPLARKLLSIIAIIIVLAICVYLLRFPLSSIFSSKLYISLAAENTIKSLKREIMAFTAENGVVKRGVYLLGEPSRHSLHLDAGAFGLVDHALDITLLNDNKREQLLFEMSDGIAGFYLSNDLIGLKINNNTFSESPNTAGSMINSMLEDGGYDIRLPDELVMSYGTFKRLHTGGSLGAVAPAYDRIYNRYRNLIQSLYNNAKIKRSSNEKFSLGSKTVSCKTISMQIPGQEMKIWLNALADTMRDDEDLAALIGAHKDNVERMIRDRLFFYSGNVFVKFYCYGDRIVSVCFSHFESQTFYQISTLGEQNRLDNISFIELGTREIKFQAVCDYIPPDEYHINLFVNGLGKPDALDQLQIVWELSKGSDNVTLGKAGKVLGRFTFIENEDGILIDVPSDDTGGRAIYTLKEMNERPEWPADTR